MKDISTTTLTATRVSSKAQLSCKACAKLLQGRLGRKAAEAYPGGSARINTDYYVLKGRKSMIRRGGWNFPGFPGEDYPPPESITIAGREVRAGDRVRLHPKKGRADIFDMMLDGKTGTIEVIHQDFENRIYLVVTADDDPALEQMQMDKRVFPGHLFYFFPEEVELLEGS